MSNKSNQDDTGDFLRIPEEFASTLSESQQIFLSSSSVAVRECVIRVDNVLNSPRNETRLGDFYAEFAYLRQALIREENPYISIDEIMSAIVEYSAEKDHSLFTRRGEPNYVEKSNNPGGEVLPKRRQGE